MQSQRQQKPATKLPLSGFGVRRFMLCCDNIPMLHQVVDVDTACPLFVGKFPSKVFAALVANARNRFRRELGSSSHRAILTPNDIRFQFKLGHCRLARSGSASRLRSIHRRERERHERFCGVPATSRRHPAQSCESAYVSKGGSPPMPFSSPEV